MNTLTIQLTATFVFDDTNYYLNQKKLSPEEMKTMLIDTLNEQKEIRVSSGGISTTTKDFKIIP